MPNAKRARCGGKWALPWPPSARSSHVFRRARISISLPRSTKLCAATGRRIEEVLRDTGLEEQADTLVMKFSSGMYQRLGLARALVKRPSVLLLDEPTRSLDAAATAHFWATIRALALQNTTVFLATHNFAEAVAVANRLLLLHRGELLADRLLGADESADELRALYFRLTGQVDEAQDAIHRAGAAS